MNLQQRYPLGTPLKRLLACIFFSGLSILIIPGTLRRVSYQGTGSVSSIYCTSQQRKCQCVEGQRARGHLPPKASYGSGRRNEEIGQTPRRSTVVQLKI